MSKTFFFIILGETERKHWVRLGHVQTVWVTHWPIMKYMSQWVTQHVWKWVALATYPPLLLKDASDANYVTTVHTLLWRSHGSGDRMSCGCLLDTKVTFALSANSFLCYGMTTVELYAQYLIEGRHKLYVNYWVQTPSVLPREIHVEYTCTYIIYI